MKATELRIGNYVELRGEKTTIWKVSKETIHAEPFDCPMCDEIKPIPLTEEWLLKFGFMSNPYQDRYELNDIYIDVDKTKGVLDLWESKTGVILKYVHSLQNLYFALTGEELTTKNNNK